MTPAEKIERYRKRHGKAMFIVALSILNRHKEDAQDVVGDALLKAATSESGCQATDFAQERNWIIRLLRNKAIDFCRTNRRSIMNQVWDDEWFESIGGVDGRIEQRVIAKIDMERALDGLSPTNRIPLIMCDAIEFNGPEVADRLGISDLTVKSRLLIARDAAWFHLEGYQDFEPAI